MSDPYNLKEYIRTVDDFPIDGIKFRDITSLIETPDAFVKTCNAMDELTKAFNPSVVVSIESRGFIFAGSISKDLALPFVLARIFRPTFLDVFQLDNLQLGTLYSTYGVVALISYLYGGTLADRFQPRILMGAALVMTSIGGFLMSTFPSFYSLQILYGFWGFSTTFLFWAAMIKATRNWGGEQSQGKAFGFLEGGRGIIAATIGGYWYFNFFKINTS